MSRECAFPIIAQKIRLHKSFIQDTISGIAIEGVKYLDSM
jgi:hypothetical protein